MGDFLKELELTEGRATGIPVILEALRHNGSPEADFETDPERTWFQVKLSIHPAFTALQNDATYEQRQVLISTKLQKQLSDQLSNEILEKSVQILLFLDTTTRKREEIMNAIGVKNYTKSVRRYIEQLEAAGLLAKTIPDKPQSPKQQYVLTDK